MDYLATPGPCPLRVQAAKLFESCLSISVHDKDLTRPMDSRTSGRTRALMHA